MAVSAEQAKAMTASDLMGKQERQGQSSTATVEQLYSDLRTEVIIQGVKLASAQLAAELAAMDREDEREELEEEIKQQREELAVVRAKVDTMWDGMYLPDQQRIARISAIQSDPIQKAYYDTASKTLHAHLSAMQIISSGKVKRAHYTALDFVAAATKHVGEYLPFIGCGIAKTIAGVIGAASDLKVQRDANKITNTAPLDHADFSKEVGMALAERRCDGITVKKAANLAAEDIKEVINKLQSTPAEDFANFNSPVTLANQIIKLLEADNKLQTAASAISGKAFTPLAVAQQKQENKQPSVFSRLFKGTATTSPTKLAAC